ncbi:MAG TPA: hypothetical protein VJW51_10515, partial [Candidatus Acidoferrales bacterium]|nr:hypothetical protein [Candidatus Acidoferrales bacterium]
MRAARSRAVPAGRAPLASVRLFFLCFLAVVVAAGRSARADSPSSPVQQEISSASFAASIEQLDSGVRHLEGDAAAARGLGESLPAKWMVGERRVDVDAGAVRELLDQYATRPQRRNALHAELSARVA